MTPPHPMAKKPAAPVAAPKAAPAQKPKGLTVADKHQNKKQAALAESYERTLALLANHLGGEFAAERDRVIADLG